jgi:Ca2+-binding RTX toxin-like protein
LARFTSIDAGTGNDSIDFSNFNASVTLSLATQSVTATGRFTSVENFIGSSRQDAITAANSANLWHLTGPSIGSINNLNFASFEVLRGGSGADQFNIGNEGSVSQIVGGNGIDTVRGPDIANSWRITQASRGTLNSQTNFQDIEHIVGGNLDDAVEMLPTGRITGSLSGGVGTNSLSYRNVTTSVAVNASPGVATYITSLAPNFQILIGGSGNDNLRAFPGIPSVLVGNAGNDTLIGSSQNDILIGGIGNDTLRGGSGQDILIAATTSHDAAPLALANLRAEWTSEQSYTQRIENLQGTSSSNNPLNNGTYLRNSPTDTLFDDSTLDSLYGDEDLDWFIANLSVDLLADRVAEEWTTNPNGA